MELLFATETVETIKLVINLLSIVLLIGLIFGIGHIAYQACRLLFWRN